MRLTPGMRFGAYEVLSTIGSGGMGEVFRAHDTRLHRDVAVKVLPDLFAEDPDRLARFGREAQVLAALNHSNIAAIYGVEESEGVRGLVLELVEGPTLVDRIAQGPLPLEEALAVARQIVDGLDAAHEHGIIHRDLKPANIKVRPDGTVKLLDFGLAKAVAADTTRPDISQSPTITSPAMTQQGVILGTAAYMSPEQARGKPIDKRADIWAFGCVLYEMLTGRRAYEGDDVPDVLVAVLSKDPEWARLPAGTPTRVKRLLVRCLEKDRKRRLRDIGDALVELNEPIGDGADEAGLVSPRALHIWQRSVPAALCLLLAIAMTGLSVWGLTRSDPIEPLPISRFALRVPLDVQAVRASPSTALAVSPDGASIVYVGQTDGSERLFRRELDQLESVPIAGSEGGRAPFFSPDGRWIGFEADGTLRRRSGESR